MQFHKNTKTLTERQKLGLYSLADIQRLSGHSQSLIWRLTHSGKAPAPTHAYGSRLYYVEAEIKDVLAAIHRYLIVENS